MKLSGLFKQSVLGLVLTAAVVPAVYAHEPNGAPDDIKCQVTEKEAATLHYNSTDSLPTYHVYNFEQKTVRRISARDGIKTIPAAALDVKERAKYEEMKRHLPKACKLKLGIK